MPGEVPEQGDRSAAPLHPGGTDTAAAPEVLGTSVDRLLTALDDAVLVVRVPFPEPAGVPGPWPVTWASESATRMLTAPVAPLAGSDLWEVLPGLGDSPERELLADTARSGRPAQFAWRDLRAQRTLELRATGRGDLVIRARDVTDEEQARGYSAQLLRLSEDLARAWEPEQVADVVAKVALPLAGVDGGGGLVIADTDHGLMRSFGWSGSDEQANRDWATYPIDLRTPGTDAWRTEQPVLMRDRDEFLHHYPHLAEDFSRLGRRAVVALPLQTPEGPLGSLVLSFSSPRAFPPVDVQFLSTVAAICAQALARAELYAQEKANVDMLQRSLLPRRVPQPAGVTVAARYQSGQTATEVGGDWWDVIALPGSVGLVLGDVEGHDLSAAALMGQVRSAVRSYALEGLPPALVVQRADVFLDSLAVDRLVTVLYLQLHPAEHLVTAVSAGHPAALVCAPGGPATFLPQSLGPPLGVQPEVARQETTSVLPADAMLVMFSDGLAERRHEDIDVGLDRVRGTLDLAACGSCPPGEHPAGFVEQVADAVLDGSTADCPATDDVALLTVALTNVRPPRGRRVSRRLPALDSSVPVARRFLENLLHAWLVPRSDHGVAAASEDMTEFIDAALLCTSEIVANAARYSSGDVVLGIGLDPLRLRVEVTDSSHRLPRLSDEGDDSAGRGLRIVDRLSDAWGVESSGLTKTVWFTLDLPADEEPVWASPGD